MDQAAHAIGIVRGTSSDEVQGIFRTLVERWRPAVVGYFD
jgi:hypothetical protein